MIDTVKLSSPPISEEAVQAIEQACYRRLSVEIATGERQWCFTSGALKGSWDSSVSVKVERERWVVGDVDQKALEALGMKRRRTGASVTKQDCPPFLVVEGSVHKALLGHNVFGGPVDPVASCKWFVHELGQRLGVDLGDGGMWTVERIDWAEAYQLPSFEACEEFVSGLNMAQFPRRRVIRFGCESLMSPGRTTALKVYHKGPEFSAHDNRRLRLAGVDAFEIMGLQEQANCILRLETEVKARKLTDDNKGRKPMVAELTRAYLEGVHDREVARLLKEAHNDMETVRTRNEVAARLHSTYDQRLANALLGTWMSLAAVGEEQTRKHLSRTTFYRQRQQLKEAGCTWLGADVHLRPMASSIPAGFSPVRRDPRRMLDQDPFVLEQLVGFGRPKPK